MPLACGVLQALEQGRGESLWPLGGRQVANAGPLPFADNLARAGQCQAAGGVGLAGIKAGNHPGGCCLRLSHGEWGLEMRPRPGWRRRTNR